MGEIRDQQVAQNGAMRRLSRERLRPGGSVRADLLTWLWRVAVVLVLLAIGWLITVFVTPLEAPPNITVDPIPPTPEVQWQSRSIGDRQARIDHLAKDYLFGFGRARPEGTTLALNVSESPEAENPEVTERDETARDTKRALAIGDVQITRQEELPADVAAALLGLELRGIYRQPESGELTAMINFVHTKDRLRSSFYQVDDVFVDEKFNQAEWRVVTVDSRFDLVVLHRSGHNMALPMYRDPRGLAAIEAALSAANPAEGSAETDSAAGEDVAEANTRLPRIETMTPAQVEQQLREAGVPAEDIRVVMALLDDPDYLVKSEALANQTKAGAEALNAVGNTSEKQGSRMQGMEAVLEMMRNNPLAPRPTEPAPESDEEGTANDPA